MRTLCFAGVALVTVLSVAGCDTDNRRAGSAPGEGGGASGAANPPNPGSPGTGAGSVARSGDAQLTAQQQTFVRQAAQANQMEVELAKMAQDKAQNQQVKEFAEQLEQDHSQALEELRRIGNQANLDLDTTPAAEKASMDAMQKASGRAFDPQFVEHMIDEHKKDISAFERQQDSATGELRAFIQKTLPVMRQHLQRAESLRKEVGS